MFQYDIASFRRVHVGYRLVHVDLSLMVAFLHEEDPGVGIEIRTILRLSLDGLVAHLLCLV